MRNIQANVKQFEEDLHELDSLITDPTADLKRVESLERWESTIYEREYLPRLPLAGVRDKNRAVLQNTADLHTHTQWSDGDDLDRVLDQALVMRLDAVAITDHDEIEGALEARRRAHDRRLPLAVVPGVEVSSADGHIGALFRNQDVSHRARRARNRTIDSRSGRDRRGAPPLRSAFYRTGVTDQTGLRRFDFAAFLSTPSNAPTRSREKA